MWLEPVYVFEAYACSFIGMITVVGYSYYGSSVPPQFYSIVASSVIVSVISKVALATVKSSSLGSGSSI